MKFFSHTDTTQERFILIGYILLFLSLLLYSFTQIDLGLAISRNESLQNIVRGFQYVGYFQRPYSTTLYIILLLLLYMLYGSVLYFVKKNKVHLRTIVKIIGIAGVIFTLSYTALSHDMFNYIFDARILTHYQSNPYIHRALDFPNDPMLGFMHWTHRVYPYGPFWLVLTVPLSFMGFGYFLPTFFLFKILTSLSYIACVYCIYHILQKVNPKSAEFGIAFFGLNPLILIEGVINSHVDLVMMAFGIWSLYLLVHNKYAYSFWIYIVSIGIKFVTAFIFPVYFYLLYRYKKKKNIHWDSIFYYFIFTIVIGIILENRQGMFQPWYLIPLISYAVFVSHYYLVSISLFIFTFFVMLSYVPYLYVGNWDPPIPLILHDIYFFGFSCAFFVTASYFLKRQNDLRKRMKK